jgi:AraC family transcriptional regulator
MEDQDIRIVTLPAMRMASFYAFSSSPETEAWNQAVNWARSHGCWQEAPIVRIFGFNNPDPSAGSPNYGYEYWVTIGDDVRTDRDTKIKDYNGGMYAVLRCDVIANPWEIIPASWGKLVKWLESSHYRHGNHQWLEEHLSRSVVNDNGFVLDLYLPISD